MALDVRYALYDATQQVFLTLDDLCDVYAWEPGRLLFQLMLFYHLCFCRFLVYNLHYYFLKIKKNHEIQALQMNENDACECYSNDKRHIPMDGCFSLSTHPGTTQSQTRPVHYTIDQCLFL